MERSKIFEVLLSMFVGPANWSPSRVPSLRENLRQEVAQVAAAFAQNPMLGANSLLLFGSCARGEATYRSDLDLLLVLESGPLNFARVKKIRDWFEENIETILTEKPLPIQLTVVLGSVYQSQEPGMAQAIKDSIPLYISSQRSHAK